MAGYLPPPRLNVPLKISFAIAIVHHSHWPVHCPKQINPVMAFDDDFDPTDWLEACAADPSEALKNPGMYMYQAQLL